MSMHSHQCTEGTELDVCLADESATARLAEMVGKVLLPGCVIWLKGDLGAGKTSFTRALLRSRGETGPVKSPTYTLIEVHPVSGIDFYHFDFYRFTQAEEFLEAGLEEYFSGKGICLVEWPDKAMPYLAPPDLEIVFSIDTDGEKHHAHLRSFSSQGEQCLTAANSFASLPPA